VGITLPHPEPELHVDAPTEPADAPDLDAGEEPLAEENRCGEAGVDDADAVAAPAVADQPGAGSRDHARPARAGDGQLARQMVRPRRRDPLLDDAGILERDRLLEHERPLLFADERIEAGRRLGDPIELFPRDTDGAHRERT